MKRLCYKFRMKIWYPLRSKIYNIPRVFIKIYNGDSSDLNAVLKVAAAIVWLIRAIWNCYVDRWNQGYLVGIATLSTIYFGAIYFGYCFFGDDLKLLENLPADNWEKRRSLGLAIAGVLGPWLAIIGYYFAAKRTQTLQQDNQIKSEQTDQDGFTKALELLGKLEISAVGSIAIIASIGARNSRYSDEAKQVLMALLTDLATIGPNGKRSDGDKFLLHIQAALNGLCKLQSTLKFATHQERNKRMVRLKTIDFSGVTINFGTRMKAFTFSKCVFEDADLGTTEFEMTHFLNCNFTGASLAHCSFLGGPVNFDGSLEGSKLIDTNISSTDFTGISGMAKDQLANCRYWKHQPPRNLSRWVDSRTLPATADGGAKPLEKNYLPPPFEMYGEDGRAPKDRYMTESEAEAFWSEWHEKHRPRDRDGIRIKIAYPKRTKNKPNQVNPLTPS